MCRAFGVHFLAHPVNVYNILKTKLHLPLVSRLPLSVKDDNMISSQPDSFYFTACHLSCAIYRFRAYH